jgi:Ni,Fe-hydrogenase I small subunit
MPKAAQIVATVIQTAKHAEIVWLVIQQKTENIASFMNATIVVIVRMF